MAENEASSSPTLQGTVATLGTEAERFQAMDQAFDYRGDVTITLSDGRTVTGYVFDRRTTGGNPCVRLMPSDGSPKLTIAYRDIAQLQFTGRDTAAGKSWETWVRKYMEKKQAGEAANLHPESLDD